MIPPLIPSSPLAAPHSFSRKDTSVIGRWWWTVDRLSFATLVMMILTGIVLSFAASPSVADRLNLGGFFFAKRHIVMAVPSFLVLIAVSLLSPRALRRVSLLFYLIGLGLLVMTLSMGAEVKGARRWIGMGSFSIQASEFMKPVFAVMSAWMLSEKLKNLHFPGFIFSFLLLVIPVTLLLCQPDLGMTIVMVMTWGGQIFIAGIPLFWIGLAVLLGIFGMLGAYVFLPHVARRIDQFLDPASGDPRHDLYQVTQSLEAFKNGGFWGMGPGEGVVKKHIPDAHADFVFAVCGEEFGFFVCLFVIGLFAFFILRTLIRLLHDQNLFIVLAGSGLILQFGLQTIINLASTLHIIPTKGMTLPFVSYGGSSMLALAIGIGMVLSLTRKRHGGTQERVRLGMIGR